jgi:hypothetical protein
MIESYESNLCDCGNIFKVELLTDQFTTLVFLCSCCERELYKELSIPYENGDI